ncbi:MAG: Periplasmic serine endoprotease DegP [Verrucomicrobiae bacterium]|nr:Periplasmic serine endoprotease DegP [Verrucomicrobiae bacterium]
MSQDYKSRLQPHGKLDTPNMPETGHGCKTEFHSTLPRLPVSHVIAMKTTLLVAVLALVTIAGNTPAAPTPLQAFSDSFADVAERVRPSVVTIYSEKVVKLPRFHPFSDGSPFQWFFEEEDSARPRRSVPREFKQTGMGSGMVLDKEGHILTNNHVVDDVDDVKVKFTDGTILDAEIIGTDPATDIAVLKLKGKLPADLAPAALGDSDALRVGEWVLAIGAPFGFEQTVTAGIISAKGRGQVDGRRGNYEDFLQTDAAINRGNSGGPLVNLRGEVIGINTAIISASGQSAGVGFAIPVNMAKRITRDLVKSGHVTRGFLGVIIQDITPTLAEQFKLGQTKGSIVAQVNKDTPAEKAGIQAGDVIVRFAGQPVEDTRNLRNRVAATDPGAKTDVVVLRDGKEKKLVVTLGELPDDDASPARERRGNRRSETKTDYGLTVEPLTDRQAQALGLDKETGVMIAEVEPGSSAAEAGLRTGDLIVEVNRQRVTNVEEFRKGLKDAKDKALLLVKNQEASRFVVLPLK